MAEVIVRKRNDDGRKDYSLDMLFACKVVPEYIKLRANAHNLANLVHFVLNG